MSGRPRWEREGGGGLCDRMTNEATHSKLTKLSIVTPMTNCLTQSQPLSKLSINTRENELQEICDIFFALQPFPEKKQENLENPENLDFEKILQENLETPKNHRKPFA